MVIQNKVINYIVFSQKFIWFFQTSFIWKVGHNALIVIIISVSVKLLFFSQNSLCAFAIFKA